MSRGPDAGSKKSSLLDDCDPTSECPSAVVPEPESLRTEVSDEGAVEAKTPTEAKTPVEASADAVTSEKNR